MTGIFLFEKPCSHCVLRYGLWRGTGRTSGRTDGWPLFLLFVYELFLLRPGILNLTRAFPYDEDFVVPDQPTDTFECNLTVDAGGPELLRNVSYLFMQIDFTNLYRIHVIVRLIYKTGKDLLKRNNY